MARPSSRNFDWGFPRWRPYGSERQAARVRTCDRDGCEAPGDRPAPKSPNNPDRWWFCEAHAAEYNKNWNYFEGLSAEDAAAREQADAGDRSYRRSQHWAWGEGDGTRSRAELDALKALELDTDADEAAIKAAHRRLVKLHHPDRNGGDAAAAAKFQAVQAAYEVLNRAAERRAASR
jgi:curved DNA-binding protein CbpA